MQMTQIKYPLLSLLTACTMLASPLSHAFWGSSLPSESEIEQSLQQELAFHRGWKVVDVEVGKEMPVDKDWLVLHKLGQALGAENSEIKQYRLDIEVEYVGQEDLLTTVGQVDGKTYLTPAIQKGDSHTFNGGLVFVDFKDSDDEFGTIFNTKPFSSASKTDQQARKAMSSFSELVKHGDLDDVVDLATKAIERDNALLEKVKADLAILDPEMQQFQTRQNELKQEKKQAFNDLTARLDAEKQAFYDKEKAAYRLALDNNKQSYDAQRTQLSEQKKALKAQVYALEKEQKDHIRGLINEDKEQVKQQLAALKAQYKELKAEASAQKKAQSAELKAQEKAILADKKQSLDSDAYKVARAEIKEDFKQRRNDVNANYKAAVADYQTQEKAQSSEMKDASKQKQQQIKDASYPQFEQAIAQAQTDIEVNEKSYKQLRQGEKDQAKQITEQYRTLESDFKAAQIKAKKDLEANFETKQAALNSQWSIKKDIVQQLTKKQRKLTSQVRDAERARSRAQKIEQSS
ncbi:similar to golgin subfamily A member 2 [Vibrio ponticus]|nr:similar to golgin subfamily A member 2 [Vibrio ponticus]